MFRFAGVGNRLFKVRHVAGYKEEQNRWAERLGFPPKDYSAWETGRMQIPIGHALRILDEVPGVTLDYLYRGTLDTVTVELSRRLRAAPDRPPVRLGRRPKRPSIIS